jgi:ubiquinone/menaquinone biosynthesis C-methylase UbiE
VGRKTAGVDGKASFSLEERLALSSPLNQPNPYMNTLDSNNKALNIPPVLSPYLKHTNDTTLTPQNILIYPIPEWTPGMIANHDFFQHTQYATHYLNTEHRDRPLRDRYQAAIGTLNHKIVIDIGCGPGNLYRLLKGNPKIGNPKIIIGIDISENALITAQTFGYTPILADAHSLPLKDTIADLVLLNATLHHCDNMAQILTEAARLVRPGGYLITDLDPQKSAWNLKGLGLLLHHSRKLSSLIPGLRKTLGHSHISWQQQLARFRTETHNRYPGDGVTTDLYHNILQPLGYSITLHPHNHTIGSEILQGQRGKAPKLIRTAQRLSGLNPDALSSALSIMCIAKRDH